MRVRWWAAVSVLVAACGSAAPGDATITVVRVIDGDTIDVRVGGRTERVRLTGIDTPELAHRPGDVAECLAVEATAFTSGLLPVGTAVRLERDVVGRDDYGRLLAYVYRADDGVFVNWEIARHGYALPLSIPPNVAAADAIVAATRAAQSSGAGLGSACGD
jgi:micrococcal nuclease